MFSVRAPSECSGPGRALWWRLPACGAVLLLMLRLLLPSPTPLTRRACPALLWNYDEVLDVADDFEGFDNETGVFSSAGEPVAVVPNTVHFLRVGQPEFSFVEYVCVLAAWRRQRPDWIMFHTDVFDFRGELWARLQATPGLREVIQIVHTEPLYEVFGQRLDRSYGPWHAGDLLRIQILIKYGGIFLDNDTYLLNSLDPLRRFEMSLGWPLYGYMGTQVLVAHPDARFLRLWLESYRGAYVGSLWYYNAGQRPTQTVLLARPELVHREPERLGVDAPLEDIYLERVYDRWRSELLAVHLFARGTRFVWWKGRGRGLAYPVVFDEHNICDYNVTLLQMAQAVLPSLCGGGGGEPAPPAATDL